MTIPRTSARRRQRDDSLTVSTAQLYREFKENHPFPFCWACGRDESQRPEGWFGVFCIERAHIVSSPRLEDVRLIVLLDTICHKVSGGERLVVNGNPWPLPKLTRANLIYLKERFDPENFAPDFMERFSVKRLPTAEAPDAIYTTEYRTRRREQWT
jgi:hypothetical protein